MGMISQIGRRSFKVRALYMTIYAVLIFGSLTMIYPFLIMLSGSTKSDVDIKTFNAIPRFFYSDLWLYRKQMEALFNEDIRLFNYAYSESETSFEFIVPPPKNGNVLMSAEMEEFLKTTQISTDAYGIGIMDSPRSKTIPANLRKFKAWLKDKYGNSIDTVNRSIGTEFVSWNNVQVRSEIYLQRREKPFKSPLNLAIKQFKTSIPRGERYYFSIPGFFRKAVLQNDYGKEIKDYNKEHGTSFASYNDIYLPQKYPVEADELSKKDWEHFVREILGVQYIGVHESATPLFQKFLKVKHGEDIVNLNKLYGTKYESFSDIPLVKEPVYEGMSSTDWTSFIIGWKDPVTEKSFQVPIEKIYITCIDYEFQDYLKTKYTTIENFNTRCAVSFKRFKEVLLPQKDFQYAYFKANRSPYKWEFITRNYKAVTEYILFHGRAIINTVIYCSLAVLIALIINPLAAYAMSRYSLPSSYKILLFLLCTMAFPPMVTAIPNFIMLRKLGLLNTFAALILPTMANGYAIFLLKGFFDSQPKELYESAELDGASEWVLFWQIAMSLSKPILAVIALQAFNLAYANFMFAFVVCQDEKMWTLMVWLYQLQQWKGQAVVYASLIIAAIPTFMIFLFCQNIIMRGIVVPSEK